MRRIEYSTQFQRDVKRCQKRGKDLPKLKAMLEMIIADDELPVRYRDHPLKGEWKGYRDAHVEPDWVLIYFADASMVRFERTGTHSDLFD